jgi:dolichol-phosphate mannosyltransferase
MQLTFQGIRLRLARPIRFGMVGISGIVVNSAILWVLAREFDLAVPLASAIATEVSILTNFLLNDRWTFRGAGRERPMRARLLRYNGIALGGLALTTGLLTLLTSVSQLPLLIANLLAIAVATAWNYVGNSRWTWRRG